MSGSEAFSLAAVIILFCACCWSIAVGVTNERAVMHHACDECDHVGECGDYECRPGVDGWQLKAGAR